MRGTARRSSGAFVKTGEGGLEDGQVFSRHLVADSALPGRIVRVVHDDDRCFGALRPPSLAYPTLQSAR